VGFGTPGKGCSECNLEGLGFGTPLCGLGYDGPPWSGYDETYLLGVVPRIVEGFQ
jgi:hypothetical protein